MISNISNVLNVQRYACWFFIYSPSKYSASASYSSTTGIGVADRDKQSYIHQFVLSVNWCLRKCWFTNKINTPTARPNANPIPAEISP